MCCSFGTDVTTFLGGSHCCARVLHSLDVAMMANAGGPEDFDTSLAGSDGRTGSNSDVAATPAITGPATDMYASVQLEPITASRFDAAENRTNGQTFENLYLATEETIWSPLLASTTSQ
jgi:hypothetical protein